MEIETGYLIFCMFRGGKMKRKEERTTGGERKEEGRKEKEKR